VKRNHDKGEDPDDKSPALDESPDPDWSSRIRTLVTITQGVLAIVQVIVAGAGLHWW
jgi:hypothetical protein